MSYSIVQVMILFIYSIFLVFSIPNTSFANASSSLIKQACSNTNLDTGLCLSLLQSDQKIASAANLFDLSIAIMQSGISNATNTRTYIENMLKKINLDSDLKGVLQECKLSYDSAIASLNSALSEVKEDKEYLTATYDLKIASTDNINRCKTAVASKKINDGTILSGNTVLPIFGFSAFNVVETLYRSTPPPSLPAMNYRRHQL